MTGISFWCETCEKDFDAPANIKRALGNEYFVAQCPDKKHEAVRFITGKTCDPYFRRSKKQKRQRMELEKDLIQPGQYGFETYYKKEYDKIETAREAHEQMEQKKLLEREAYYTKLKEAQVSSKIINRAMEAESG